MRYLILIMSLIFSTQSTEKPNVILILADDLGYSGLKCYGGQFLETPNIDQLCNDGMKFTNGLAAYPTCKPSRAALLTGQYGSRTSVYRVVDRHTGQENQIKYIVPPNKVVSHEKKVISEVFKDAGYTTAMFGKWHVSNNTDGHPSTHGFDESISSTGHYKFSSFPKVDCPKYKSSAEFFTDKANAFMSRAVKAEKPFFLYMPYYLVHRPMESKKEYIEHFKKKFGNTYEDEELPILAAMTKLLDDCVGSLVNKVKELNIEKETLIIFTSDNGAFKEIYTGGLRGSKGDTYEGGMRVPYIFHWPGKIQAGTTSHDRIIGVDIFPTLAEVIKQKNDQVTDGKSILPLLTGEKETLGKRTILCYFPKYARLSKKTKTWAQSWRNVIYEGDYKLIEYPEYGNYELFNLKVDQVESKNLFKEQPEKAQYLKNKLAKKLLEIQAPKMELNPNYNLE